MPINKKLIHFNTKLNFLGANGINNQTTEDSNGNYGNIPKTSIVFIKDTQEIWTHGLLYGLQLKEITWSELKALRDWVDPQNANNKGKLIPGLWYRITDYTCTTTQENTQSAGHVFDIIVRADDKTVLNENAYAAHHAGDTYFADSKLEAWELKYCLDNDTTKFDWADSTNGKGVIYYIKDEFNNECPYDFKNIQYADGNFGFVYSFGSASLTWTYLRDTSSDIIRDGIQYYGFKATSSGGPNILCTRTLDLSTSTTVYYDYTVFDYGYIESVLSMSFMFTFSQGENDASLNNNNSDKVYNNYIKPYNYNKKLKLNNICFKGSPYHNIFGNNCNNITFGNNCNNNHFGNNCYNNSFDDYCYNNHFGDNCYNNSFGNNCYNNSFGDSCTYNFTFNSCNYNTFGNYCNSNTLNNYCLNNYFGDNCSENRINSNCIYNTFGNYCNANALGSNCNYNTFGSNCNNNSFGNNCYNNSFGNNCNGNTFYLNCNYNHFYNNCIVIEFNKNYTQYIIIENGNSNIKLTSSQSTSSSSKLQNITIAQGVNNTSSLKTIYHNTVNDTFKTTYLSANSQVISI